MTAIIHVHNPFPAIYIRVLLGLLNLHTERATTQFDEPRKIIPSKHPKCYLDIIVWIRLTLVHRHARIRGFRSSWTVQTQAGRFRRALRVIRWLLIGQSFRHKRVF
ncbi:hypothetical protein CEXT_166211 [Caerostris extrusa]|uniref:Secreted protein n=1 Tax=Caerostris extrusa TaxID=172846 RepID=A0AAV4PFP2_CAEEX|nr:hypothetical protein CEXT_166211 [Caerostris extrusa]